MDELRYDHWIDRAVEYFCNSCGQLRLAFVAMPGCCINCGSANITIGPVDSLDKAKLKEEFNDRS